MSEVVEREPSGPMSEEDAALARELYAALQSFTVNSERGQQAQDFRVGLSDLGYCSERTRRMLDQQEPEDVDMLLAFIGTALGDHIEQAVAAAFEDAVIQPEVSVDLDGESGRTYTVPGHPDVVLRRGLVLDAKTSYDLTIPERVGADQQKQFQRHTYGRAAWEAGLFDDTVGLTDVRVGNIWLDRSGKSKRVHVQTEPLDLDVVRDAAVWLDNVVEDYLKGDVSQKEPPREVCAVTCGFYSTCRALDSDVEGRLTDPSVLAATEMYREGLTMEKDGKALKNEAKAALMGVSGFTGRHTVRWIHVNESEYPAGKRAAHQRLDIREVK